MERYGDKNLAKLQYATICLAQGYIPKDFGANSVDLNHSNYAEKFHLTRYSYLLISSSTDFMDCREEIFESFGNNQNLLEMAIQVSSTVEETSISINTNQSDKTPRGTI